MDFEVFKKSLEFATELEINDIRLTGGEATVHPDFEKYVAHAITRKFDVGLVTNGIRLVKKDMRKTLEKLSRCWISLYSLDPSEHLKIGGRASISHHQIIKYISKQERLGLESLGLSTILHPGEVNLLPDFITLCLEKGIKKLRFIPWQPDGRGETLHENRNMSNYISEVKKAYEIIKSFQSNENSLVQLTINDPFDIGSRYSNSQDSCLLKERGMWSITSDGDVFSCCFNAYDNKQRLGNVRENDISNRIREYNLGQIIRNCRGLDSNFWSKDKPTMCTCPIGAIGVK